VAKTAAAAVFCYSGSSSAEETYLMKMQNMCSGEEAIKLEEGRRRNRGRGNMEACRRTIEERRGREAQSMKNPSNPQRRPKSEKNDYHLHQ